MRTSIHPPTDASIDAQLEALTDMTVTQLRVRYTEVFGEQTTSGNKQWLYRRVAWRIQALAYGGLSERARQRAAELARDADIRVQAPRAIAPQRPTNASNRVLTLTGKVVASSDTRLPPPGSVLRRTWKGVEHEVTVLPSGFEYRGATYRSLSAVATAISGSHWNGFGFFGLIGKDSK
ncbi:MAG TPA: DUF2924 domain-containing protein [Phycisphaerales bacterium]|nr:DUF2924 domain-containing protein [Phycisphaerales bacterium]